MIRVTLQLVRCLTIFGVMGVAFVPAASAEPLRLIFDTDMGNDVDDALALGVIHSLQSRQECQLLAVTVTKDHRLCAPYVDAVNTFYGRGEIPIGVVKQGMTPDDSKFLPACQAKDDGKWRYPHDLLSSDDAADATTILRRTLAAQPDHSVAIAQVGFSTNLARLLESPADAISSLNGRQLVAKKVKLLSVMAGAFQKIGDNAHFTEYNVVKDVAAAKLIADQWPTPIVYSGFEIGISIPYPAASIEHDFAYVAHHPLQESYQLYSPTPHERPTWDLTSVLHAVRPERGYFSLSPPGTVTVADDGFTSFEPSDDGKHRYLTLDKLQIEKAKEALVQLSSQPPEISHHKANPQ
jgi:inosine-uridine nucleoside N-ribohydrolase